MTDKTNPEELITEMKALIENMPRLDVLPIPPITHKWLGDACALVNASGLIREENDLRAAIEEYNVSSNEYYIKKAANKIKSIMQIALSMLERKVN